MRPVVCLVAVFVILAVGTPVGAQDQEEPEPYISECAGCHGAVGEGTVWAPEIREEGAAGADFMMRTGRMPLRDPNDPVRRSAPRLSDGQMQQITAYVEGFGGPAVPEPHPENGDVGLGAQLYQVNCAACHGATGVGAALVNSDNAPDLLQADSLEIAEAVRSGPLSMPNFGPDSLDDHDLDSLVLYVTDLTGAESSRGGWNLGRWGPVAEGAVAWLIGIAAVIGAAAWIEGDREEAEDE